MRDPRDMEGEHRRLPLPLPEQPPPGPFRRDFWRSPLRGPWLSSFLGASLLPLILIAAITGFLSHSAYDPDLGKNAITGAPGGGFDLYFFQWPSSPAWIYVVTQGLHVIAGLAAIPVLLAKLWSVIPKLFEWPPVRSVAHSLERLSVALLVGGSLFVFTGVLNIQLYYPWAFSFVPAHYYGAFVFLAALALHIGLKLGVARRAFARMGVLRPLRKGLADTLPEPAELETTAPSAPAPATISRRGLLATGQVVGGPLRPLGLLAPRGRVAGTGPNDFPVNKTAASIGLKPDQTGPGWRLELAGPNPVSLSRAQLLELPQSTHDLPIACVEGWSTTQSWTGVPLRDLARMAGLEAPDGAARRVAPGVRHLPPGHAQSRPGRGLAFAARAQGQRHRPVARPRLPRARDRARAAGRTLHQVGREDDLQDGLPRTRSPRDLKIPLRSGTSGLAAPGR